MTKREVNKRIDEVNFEMIEAAGEIYVELQIELEELQLELEIMNSFGVEQLDESEDLNFNVGNVGAFYK